MGDVAEHGPDQWTNTMDQYGALWKQTNAPELLDTTSIKWVDCPRPGLHIERKTPDQLEPEHLAWAMPISIASAKTESTPRS